jgi:glucokinase
MNTDQEYAIGLDIGGTKILAAIIDRNGNVLNQSQTPTSPELGYEITMERVLTAVRTVLADSQVKRNRIRGIGVATAGVINTATNEVIFANNLGWEDVPLGQIIEHQFGLPVQLNNDASTAVIAESIWGAGRGIDDLIYVTVSTGIGAGIISGGRLMTGVSDSAGEFGHITIRDDGPRCGCGNYGCLETYASGTAIARMAIEQMKQSGPRARLPIAERAISEITAKEVIEAAEAGEPGAVEIIKKAGYYLGVGTVNLIHLFNPSMIVFGGGVIGGGSMILAEVERTLNERCIEGMLQNVRISKSILGNEISVKGAAGLFFLDKNDNSGFKQSRIRS